MNSWDPGESGRFLEHYETLRGTVRQALVERQLSEHLVRPPARICDVGGGAGHNSIPLARRGYEVTILDPSEEMLQGARQALHAEDEAVRDLVRLVGGDGESAPRIFGRETFDAVLCHGVLIYVREPEPLIEALSQIARPGAVISILTKNAEALAMRPALEGRYEQALAAFDSVREINTLGMDTRTDTIPQLSTKLESHGIELQRWYGVRVFTDHLDDRPAGPDLPEILAAEWEAGRRDPYRRVARLVHVVGRKATG
ncbi:MAG: methyltransferase domain-containing protein [Rubrobacteraceae bacterium]